uniref:Putative secreted protein n=1 Tax=Anopheles darlingi TaxID=43151 RepID=A0A2M4DGM9_ANODA
MFRCFVYGVVSCGFLIGVGLWSFFIGSYSSSITSVFSDNFSEPFLRHSDANFSHVRMSSFGETTSECT